MSNTQENIYTVGGEDFVRAEIDRMHALAFPQLVTVKAFELYGIDTQNLLDVGSGSNPHLALHVTQRGGTYTALDINAANFASLLRALPDVPELRNRVRTVQGDAAQGLPFTPESFTTTHSRFVLSHIASPEGRKTAISHILAVAPQAVFLDFDWSSMRAQGLAEKFRTAALEFFQVISFNADYGKLLENEVRTVLPKGAQADVQTTRFSREPGSYYHEILGLASSVLRAPMINRLESIKANLSEVVDTLTTLNGDYSTLPAFTPPDIVCVVVKR